VGSEDAAVDDLPCLLDTARLTPELLMRAGAVRLLGLDVDGVLTDGTVWYGPTGETLKGFSILDGLGLRLLRDAGIGVAIITARQSTALRARMDDLGITDVCMGGARQGRRLAHAARQPWAWRSTRRLHGR
jgi:3-deoxy-D-manno-octulosonate 8-phosphate phosphatase (KDO 8-P phosphatase)